MLLVGPIIDPVPEPEPEIIGNNMTNNYEIILGY